MPPITSETYTTLFETAPDATFVVDGRGLIVLANAQAERLFGRARAELVGQPIEVLIPERFRAAHTGQRHGYTQAAAIRLMGSRPHLLALRADGSEIPVEIALGPIGSGSEPLFVAAVRDVSDLARTREAALRGRYNLHVAQFGMLALQQPHFPALLDAAAPAVAEAMRADAVLVFMVEPGGREVRGTAAHGIPSGLLARLRAPNDSSALPGYVIGRREPVVVADVEADSPAPPVAALHGLGLRSAVCVPLFSGADAIGAITAWGRAPGRWGDDDLHFMQSIANTISAANQRAAAEERLLHAQRLEALGQLTGGVAHDFNNLLMVISGSLQMIEDIAADRPAAIELSRQAMGAADRGAALTRKLLAFARKQPLNPLPVDLNHLLTDFRDLVQRTLGEQVAIRLHLDPELPIVVTDSGQLETALLNLALNARDAMPGGGILVLETRVQRPGEAQPTVPELPPGAYARVSVRDSGFGMGPEVLARAIEPFFTTKDAGKGSGLGLSMVYGFARQSGGTAVLDSEPGKGTTVTLYLPLSPDLASAGPVPKTVPLPSGNETVLVVEDDASVLRIAASFLGRLGYRVIEARDADSALQLLRGHPAIKLLFTDVSLPGMDGVDLAQAVRALKPGMPVLFTSAYLSSGAIERLPQEERITVLAKPYRREELALRIRSLLAPRTGP